MFLSKWWKAVLNRTSPCFISYVKTNLDKALVKGQACVFFVLELGKTGVQLSDGPLYLKFLFNHINEQSIVLWETYSQEVYSFCKKG